MNLSLYEKEIQEKIRECERATAAGERSALRKLGELKKIAKEKNDPALLGFTEFYRANWYYDDSQYEKYHNSLEAAIQSLLRTKEYELLARSYNFFAIDAQNNDALDVAYSYYTSALQFTDEETAPSVTGVILHNLANLYAAIADYKLARKHYRRSLRLLEGNKEDPFYHRNLLIAYISDGINSVVLKDLPAAKKTFRIVRSLAEELEDTQLPDVLLDYHFFEVRLALLAGDHKTVEERSGVILEELKDDAMSFMEMDDIRDFCFSLMEHGLLDLTGSILSLITPAVLNANIAHAMRSLTEAKVEYYDKINDEKQLIKALREQHRLMNLQKEEQAKIYQYSISLIKQVGKLQEEEVAVRLENENLQIRILTDDLTGIANRYAFDKELDAAFERAYQKNAEFGVEILDVDGLKAYNDRYGHQAGDTCLVTVGKVLETVAKEHGVFCARYGGDEFVVIYEGKTDGEILTIAQQIDADVTRCTAAMQSDMPQTKITVSQGICNDIPKAKSKPWDYLFEADSALYSVKGTKKKRIPIRRLRGFE